MRSPMSEFVNSPPASTTMMSPCSAMLSAQCTIRLSPGAVRTVSAGPAIAPPEWYGRSRAPPAVMRDIESLTFATGRFRYFSAHCASTLRLRLSTLKPTAMVPPLSCYPDSMHVHKGFARLARCNITSWGQHMQNEELLSKLDLIEEQARLTLD